MKFLTALTKSKLVFATFAFSLLIGCDKEESLPEDDKLNEPVGDGCYINSILSEKAAPLFSYFYLDDSPTIIDFFYEHDPLTAAVRHTYSFRYSKATNVGLRIDSVFYYIGDIYLYGPGEFSTMTTYHYTNYGTTFDRLDSAIVHLPTYVPEEPYGPKGTIFYEYEDGLLVEESYFDNPVFSPGTYMDNYVIEYSYNNDGQVTEWNYFNYLDQLSYYEKYELTSFFQPNIKVTVNPDLVRAFLYAPSKLTVPAYLNGRINGTYMYNYDYQVNEHNYIVEQSLLENGTPTTLLKLITYSCYYD